MKNDLKNLAPQELMIMVNFCSAAMTIINARLFTLIGLVFCATAFGWLLWEPDWIRFAGACAFAVLVFWPLQRMEARREVTVKGQSDE